MSNAGLLAVVEVVAVGYGGEDVGELSGFVGGGVAFGTK